jgi:hypothetical protein
MDKNYNLKIKKYLIIFVFALLISLPAIAIAQSAFAQSQDTYGLKTAAKEAGFNEKPQTPRIIIGKIINYALTFVGVIFLVLTIYAGFLWMTAGGNEETVKKAKKWLVNSVVGLAIVLAAYSITNFILLQFINATK